MGDILTKMENRIKLKGILTNIEPSHVIQGIEFNKANLIVPREDGKEDVLNLRFKRFSNPYVENQEISLTGNVRSYSTKLENGKNHVELYVFTYFDIPELNENDQEDINKLEIYKKYLKKAIRDCSETSTYFDGRVCKIEELRQTRSGRNNIHLIVANNLIVSEGSKKLNSYIPCIGWGDVAVELSKLKVNTPIKIYGALHSREYRKTFEDGSFEIRVAHECVIDSFELI